MVIELCVVQFWSEIILVISNKTRAARSFDFEITRMISDQIALHSVQLPLLIGQCTRHAWCNWTTEYASFAHAVIKSISKLFSSVVLFLFTKKLNCWLFFSNFVRAMINW